MLNTYLVGSFYRFRLFAIPSFKVQLRLRVRRTEVDKGLSAYIGLLWLL